MIGIGNFKLNNNYGLNLRLGDFYAENPSSYCASTKKKDCFQTQNPVHQVSFGGKTTIFQHIRRTILRTLNRFDIKLTKYDAPEIKKTRQKLLRNANTQPPTCLIRTPERRQLRVDIINYLLQSQPNVDKNREFYCIFGLPGAGKSTLSEKIAAGKKAFQIDIDALKFMIPEYKQNQCMDFVVNSEAQQINNALYVSTTREGCNIVAEDCGFAEKLTIQKLKNMRAKGYKVHLIMIKLSMDKAVERALARFKETNRFTDPLFHSLFGNRTQRTYNSILTDYPELFDSASVYSSDVPRGEPFRLLSGSDLNL